MRARSLYDRPTGGFEPRARRSLRFRPGGAGGRTGDFRSPVGLLAGAALAGLASSASAFEDLESRVVEFELGNGLKFLVVERHDAPVFSFRTYVDAGGVDEVPGITGIAHMFEHMAFKGTHTIGTTDYAAEQSALAAVDRAWDAYAAEEAKGFRADSTRLEQLQETFLAAQGAAKEFVISNDFSRILEENGVRGLNASTGTDLTWYYYSLPSNRLELWARLEGDRLTNPVLREFYTERDVVIEERRFQESSPVGRLFESALGAAFFAHPYGNGVIGYASDLRKITRRDAEEFFRKHYVASNITVCVVGDVDAAEVRALAERYFSAVASGSEPPPVRTEEPRHDAQVRVIREEDAQPVVTVAFMIPGRFHPQWHAYELLGSLLANGRSSRIYTRLVKEDQSCSRIFGGSGFPGSKYPCALALAGFVNSGSDPAAVEAAIFEETERLADEGVTDAELDKAKRLARADFIRQIQSNSGLSGQLALYQGMLGDWRLLFRELDRIEAVTPARVQEAAKESLRRSNSVVGILRAPGDASGE
jgi:predicted Zn-dependent peptidase